MRVNNVCKLFRRAFHFQRQNRLRDQLSRIRPDDVYAQDLSVLRVGHDLDETFVLADDAGPRVGGKGKLADLYLVALLFGLGFGKPDAAISGWQ